MLGTGILSESKTTAVISTLPPSWLLTFTVSVCTMMVCTSLHAIAVGVGVGRPGVTEGVTPEGPPNTITSKLADRPVNGLPATVCAVSVPPLNASSEPLTDPSARVRLPSGSVTRKPGAAVSSMGSSATGRPAASLSSTEKFVVRPCANTMSSTRRVRVPASVESVASLRSDPARTGVAVRVGVAGAPGVLDDAPPPPPPPPPPQALVTTVSAAIRVHVPSRCCILTPPRRAVTTLTRRPYRRR